MKKLTKDKTLSKQVNVSFCLLINIYQIYICYGKRDYAFMLHTSLIKKNCLRPIKIVKQ